MDHKSCSVTRAAAARLSINYVKEAMCAVKPIHRPPFPPHIQHLAQHTQTMFTHGGRDSGGVEGRREGEEKAEDYMLGGVEGMVHLLGLRGHRFIWCS